MHHNKTIGFCSPLDITSETDEQSNVFKNDLLPRYPKLQSGDTDEAGIGGGGGEPEH